MTDQHKCDHPLIQEKWQPKVGDRYYDRDLECESMVLTETLLRPGYIENLKKHIWLARIEDYIRLLMETGKK